MTKEYASFAYGASRSGKTTYHSVVLLRDDLSRPGDDLRWVQGFLFVPTEDNPQGELNKPYRVHKARLSNVEDALQDWRRIGEVRTAELLEDLIASDL